MRRLRTLPPALLALAALGPAEPTKKPTAPVVDLGEMVAFEAGTFRMGIEADEVASPYGDPWFFDQKPAHDVTLEAFHLDRHEVTVSEFALFLTHAAGEYHYDPAQPIDRVAGGYLPTPGFADHPITYVTWEAAHHYCLWAGKRLPTEAEWERAAAGLEGRTFPWGEEKPSCKRTTYFTGSSYCQRGPVPVGSHPGGATPEGVEGLAGNVAEWVADRYAPYPAEPQTDPRGPEQGWYRVVRGGSHLESGVMLRTRARRQARPDRGASSIGFRCAYDAPSDETLRGAIEPPSEDGREDHDQFAAEAAPAPEILVEGLAEPIDLQAAADSHFLVERGAGRITRVDLTTGEVEPWAEPLDDPRHLAAGDHLFVTEATGLSRIEDDGTITQLAALDDPTHLAPSGSTVHVATSSGIVEVAGGATTVASSETGIEALALGTDALFYASRDGRSIGRVSLSDGTETTLVDGAALEPGYYPSALAVSGSVVHFVQRRDGFPNAGLLCTVPSAGGAIDCTSHSPIHPERLRVGEGRTLWAGRQVIAEADAPPGDWRVAAAWTRAGGLILHEGELVFADRHDGRIYRAPRPR